MATHIDVMDGWAFYQAKKMRQTIYNTQIGVLENLPNASSASTQAEIARSRATAARMEDEPCKDGEGEEGECEEGDGMIQIKDRTLEKMELEEEALEHYEGMERVVGLLQISIVFASVAVVTKCWELAFLGGAVGLLAAGFGVSLAHPATWFSPGHGGE